MSRYILSQSVGNATDYLKDNKIGKLGNLFGLQRKLGLPGKIGFSGTRLFRRLLPADTFSVPYIEGSAQ